MDPAHCAAAGPRVNRQSRLKSTPEIGCPQPRGGVAPKGAATARRILNARSDGGDLMRRAFMPFLSADRRVAVKRPKSLLRLNPELTTDHADNTDRSSPPSRPAWATPSVRSVSSVVRSAPPSMNFAHAGNRPNQIREISEPADRHGLPKGAHGDDLWCWLAFSNSSPLNPRPRRSSPADCSIPAGPRSANQPPGIRDAAPY